MTFPLTDIISTTTAPGSRAPATSVTVSTVLSMGVATMTTSAPSTAREFDATKLNLGFLIIRLFVSEPTTERPRERK